MNPFIHLLFALKIWPMARDYAKASFLVLGQKIFLDFIGHR